MKQESNKNAESRVSIAWFKLAELISRGEKEKALSLYRLLSHSFEDRAYALQIEGDILWSFEDDKALELYEQAAFLYKKEGNVVSAIAIYEHLLTLQPNNGAVLEQLVVLYAKLDWPEKFKDRFKIFVDLLDNEEVVEDDVREVLQQVRSVVPDEESGVYTALVGLLQESVPQLAKELG